MYGGNCGLGCLPKAGPFAELLVGIDTDQWNLVLVAQGRDQLLVLRLVAALGENAQHGLAFVERLARFVNAVHQSVGDQRLLQHLLEGGVDIHRAIDGRTRGFTQGHMEDRCAALTTKHIFRIR
uniref:Uncharacterized protein n=1 Tax=Anopheles melas TaxID=34690 RepID=A0A182U215_9DIPT